MSCFGIFVGGSTAAQDKATRYVSDDGIPPISAIIGYSVIGADSAIAIDNTESIFLLESDRRTKKIGQNGDGPCEVWDVTSFAVVGDTIFVLDSSLGRITGYSISSGDCTAEVVHPELTAFSAIGKAGGWFYLVRTKYISVAPPEEPLLYRFSASGVLESLDLTIADLETDLLMVPVRIGRGVRQLREKDGAFYFLLPFSHRVWRYDTRTRRVSSISLVNDSPDISQYSNSTDPATISRIVPQLEFESNLFLLGDHLAVLSNFERKWKLGLYSYSGDLLVKDAVSDQIIFEEGSNYYTLIETESETNPYAIRVVDPPTRR